MSRDMSYYKRPKVFGEKCLGHGIIPSWNMDAILAAKHGRVRPLLTVDSTGERSTSQRTHGISDKRVPAVQESKDSTRNFRQANLIYQRAEGIFLESRSQHLKIYRGSMELNQP